MKRGMPVNNDLISRAALQKSMAAVVFKNVPVEHQPYMQVVCDTFAHLVIEAPTVDAEPVRQWISVKDRLPDDLEEVLILVKETEFYGQYKEFSKSYFCQYIGCVDDGEWYTVWCHGHRYIKDTAKEPYADKLEVTHWMPLPELPQDKAKAGE